MSSALEGNGIFKASGYRACQAPDIFFQGLRASALPEPSYMTVHGFLPGSDSRHMTDQPTLPEGSHGAAVCKAGVNGVGWTSTQVEVEGCPHCHLPTHYSSMSTNSRLDTRPLEDHDSQVEDRVYFT